MDGRGRAWYVVGDLASAVAACQRRVTLSPGFARLARIDRSPPPEDLKRFREHLGLAQHALAAPLRLGRNRVWEYEQHGAPELVRLARIGLVQVHFGASPGGLAW
jgi:DNA-binding transcriptional regulator YiaG